MKNLLKYFHDLTIHPKNAAELKGLILQLAVQGKLTAQWRLENPDVEPASVLLKRIQAEKTQLVKEKKIREEKPLPVITENEIFFELPESWAWCRLGDITDLPYGKGLSKKDLLETGYDVFGANGIIGKYSSYLYKEEQLLISCRGAYSGKTNISPPRCFVTSNSLVCEFYSKEATYYKFFYYAITALPKEKIVSGSAQPQVTATNAKPLPISLPPLEEQKAIVSVVEQLFVEVEQLEALTKERIRLKADFVASALQQLTNSEKINGEWAFLQQHFSTFFTELPNIKKLRESILQLAVQGKLTTHWRSRHPELVAGSHSAKALLERIKTEKAQLVKAGKIKKEKPLPKITAEEIPYELPEGWVWCRMGEILNLFLGGFAYESSKFISSSNNQVLRLGNVKNNLIRFESNPVFITDDYAKHSSGYRLTNGDILITMTGTRAKRDYCFTTLLNETHFEKKKLFLNQRVGCLRFNNNCSLGFIDLALKESALLDPIFDKATGTANQANIGKGAIVENLFPLPPLEEQKAIVEKVNTLMALCDQLEQEIQTSQSTREYWMKSSLREVFAEAKPKAKTTAMDLDGGELGMVAEPETKYNN